MLIHKLKRELHFINKVQYNNSVLLINLALLHKERYNMPYLYLINLKSYIGKKTK